MKTRRHLLIALVGSSLLIGGYGLGRWHGVAQTSNRSSQAESDVARQHDEPEGRIAPPPVVPPSLREPLVQGIDESEAHADLADPAEESDPFGASSEFGDATDLKGDPRFNPDGKTLSRPELQMLEGLVAQYNRDIEYQRQGAVKEAIDRHVDSLIAAGFYQSVAPGERVRSKNANHALGVRSDGTSIRSVEYDPNQVPEIVAARATLDEMRTRYRDELVRFFAAIPD